MSSSLQSRRGPYPHRRRRGTCTPPPRSCLRLPECTIRWVAVSRRCSVLPPLPLRCRLDRLRKGPRRWRRCRRRRRRHNSPTAPPRLPTPRTAQRRGGTTGVSDRLVLSRRQRRRTARPRLTTARPPQCLPLLRHLGLRLCRVSATAFTSRNPVSTCRPEPAAHEVSPGSDAAASRPVGNLNSRIRRMWKILRELRTDEKRLPACDRRSQ